MSADWRHMPASPANVRYLDVLRKMGFVWSPQWEAKVRRRFFGSVNARNINKRPLDAVHTYHEKKEQEVDLSIGLYDNTGTGAEWLRRLGQETRTHNVAMVGESYMVLGERGGQYYVASGDANSECFRCLHRTKEAAESHYARLLELADEPPVEGRPVFDRGGTHVGWTGPVNTGSVSSEKERRGAGRLPWCGGAPGHIHSCDAPPFQERPKGEAGGQR